MARAQVEYPVALGAPKAQSWTTKRTKSTKSTKGSPSSSVRAANSPLVSLVVLVVDLSMAALTRHLQCPRE